MRCWKPKQDNRSRRHPHHCERPSLPKIFLTATADRRSVLGAGLTGLLASMGWTTPVHATAASAGIDDLLDLSASAYGTVGHSVAVLRRGRLVYSRYAGLWELPRTRFEAWDGRYVRGSYLALLASFENSRARSTNALNAAEGCRLPG